MKLSLVNLPRFEIHRPPLAIAILSTLCKNRNVNFNCLDLNLKIFQDLPEQFEEIDNYCITNNITPETKNILEELIDRYILSEVNDGVTVFCLSLLSMYSLNICELVCKRIRALTDAEILLGGQGLANETWVQTLKLSNLLDYYIIGEGEITFDLFLTGKFDKSTPGINNFNFQQIDDLDKHCVIPDYTKLNVENYPYLEDVELFITGSRGCVRRCTYCDIGHQWKKYRYRSGDNIANEMISQYERHGITNFFFTDSLVNGSMKMLNDLCDTLIAYRDNNPAATFSWKGQYIFRPKSQIKEDHIAKLKAAGCELLIVGLETGSNKVRIEMDKKTHNGRRRVVFGNVQKI